MEISIKMLKQKRKEYQESALKYIDNDPERHAYYLGKANAIYDLIFDWAKEEMLNNKN